MQFHENIKGLVEHWMNITTQQTYQQQLAALEQHVHQHRARLHAINTSAIRRAFRPAASSLPHGLPYAANYKGGTRGEHDG